MARQEKALWTRDLVQRRHDCRQKIKRISIAIVDSLASPPLLKDEDVSSNEDDLGNSKQFS